MGKPRGRIEGERKSQSHHRHLHRRDEEQNHQEELNPFTQRGGFNSGKKSPDPP